MCNLPNQQPGTLPVNAVALFTGALGGFLRAQVNIDHVLANQIRGINPLIYFGGISLIVLTALLLDIYFIARHVKKHRQPSPGAETRL
jgi:hypothetical protein